MFHNKRGHCNEKPMNCNEEEPLRLQLEDRAHAETKDPAQPKKKKVFWKERMNWSRMNFLELKAVPAFINHPLGTEKGHVPGEGPAPPVESARHPSAS